MIPAKVTSDEQLMARDSRKNASRLRPTQLWT